MVNVETIEQEILELEKKDASYAVVERLAWLYIVRDHLLPPASEPRTSRFIGDRFREACSDVPIESLMDILCEHMQAIELAYPKEYEAIIKKISALK